MAIFLTWHLSQRSRNLANKLSLPLLAIQPEHNSFYRFSVCTTWTIFQLAKRRPQFIVLQYSYLLLLVLSVYKLLNSSVVIVCDCHTKALRRSVNGPLRSLFWAAKKWSFSKTDLAIVHNKELVPELEQLTSNILVMHDPLPEFLPDPAGNDMRLAAEPEAVIVFVCSYAVDEPVEQMLTAAKRLVVNNHVYMTGAVPVKLKRLQQNKNTAIRFTGYLDDLKYQQLLASASVIVALTSESACLQCAAFEALVVNKPFVTSDTTALRDLLGAAAVYVANQAQSIEFGVNQALAAKQELTERLLVRKKILEEEFESKLVAVTVLSNRHKLT